MALIDANMSIQGGKLITTFTVNRKMNHQDRLQAWFDCFIDTLQSAVHDLNGMPPSLSLSDIPNVSLSYRGLENLLDNQLPSLGLEAKDVVGVYPTTPMQEGILLSSSRGTSDYATFWIWKCFSTETGRTVSTVRLQEAWRALIHRHQILSTVFSPHPESSGYVQIALSSCEERIRHFNAGSQLPAEFLRKLDRPTFGSNVPEHAFTICSSGSDVALRLDINHTLLDGSSLMPLLQDFAALYEGRVLPAAPCFGDIVSSIRQRHKANNTLEYWTRFLEGVKRDDSGRRAQPFGPSSKDAFEYLHISEAIAAGILPFCKSRAITRSVFLQVAWALALSQLSGTRDVCFGYLASGRSAEIEGVDRLVGPLANMLISRIDLNAPPQMVLEKTAQDSISHLEHQHISLAEVQHAIGVKSGRLFANAMTVRQVDDYNTVAKCKIAMEYCGHEDPHEYELLLSGGLQKDETKVAIQVRTAIVDSQHSERARTLLEQAFEYLITSGIGSDSDQIDSSRSHRQHAASLYDHFFETITGEDEDSALAFWANHFQDLEVTHFPTSDTAGPQIQREDHVTLKVSGLSLPADQPTAMATIWSAWAIVAAMNTGSSDAVFGANIEPEEASRWARSVLPVRVFVDWEITACQLLETVRRQIACVKPFGRTNIETVRRSSQASALACDFSTALVMRRDDGSCWTPTNEKSEIVVEVEPRDGETLVTIYFDKHITSEECVNHLARQLGHNIRWLSAATTDNIALREAIRISPRDLDQIWTWNQFLPLPVKTPVHSMIDAVALRSPDAHAVQAWDGGLTYKQLTDLSSDLAHRLLDMGVGPTHVIPLCFEKSMWTPVAMLAVMKSGAAALALDTTQPEEYLRQITGQTNPPLIISSVPNRVLAESLVPANVVLLGEGTLESQQDGVEQAKALPAIEPLSTLFVVFTSGSTGTPKGTMITHENFSSLIEYQREALGITSESRVFDFASYAFDIAWCNLLHTLSCGGCLCIPSESDRRNYPERSIVSLQANYAHITPTLLRYLDWSKLERVQTIVLSGEAVLSSDRKRLPPNVRLINAYGPAETNVVTIQELGALPPGKVSIGWGIGACTWVVECHGTGRLAPIGAVGELWIEGPLVGGGYLNDDFKTKVVFVEDPSWLAEGAVNHAGRRGRLYRTGDLVRYEYDGSLVYVARKDRQVKLRGQRLDLGDVETHVLAAMRRKDIQITAECIQPQHSDSMLLAAFVTILGAEHMSDQQHESAVREATAGLLEELSKTVPQFKVPSVYIPLAKLPLTSTGKTDRRQLQKIGVSLSAEKVASLKQPKAAYAPPTTDIERLMQALWANTLHILPSNIGVDDDFFCLGGESIAAMRLVSECRDKGLEITVKDIFQASQLRRLSARVRPTNTSKETAYHPFSLLQDPAHALETRTVAARLAQVQLGDVVDVLPCTPLQCRMMESQSIDGRKITSRHILELRADTDLTKLEDTVRQATSRNPIMRTRIVTAPHEGLVQVVLRSSFDWVSGLTLEQYDQYANERPMQADTPLMRFAIVQDPEGKGHSLLWELHWASYDGWSLRMMIAEIEALYHGLAGEPLEPMTGFMQYLHARDKAGASAYWAQQFDDLENAHFPKLVTGLGPLPSKTYVSVRDVVPTEDWSSKSFTRATYLRAALALTMAENLGSQQALFGVVMTGRQIPVRNMARMAGPAFSVVPVKIGCEQDAAVGSFLAAVQEQTSNMLPHEHTSLERIRLASRRAASACDFRTLLVIQGAIDEADPRRRDPGKQIFTKDLVVKEETILELGQRFGDCPFFVECQLPLDGEAYLRFYFDTAIVAQDVAKRMMKQFRSAIRQLCLLGQGQQTLRDVDLRVE